MVGKLEQRDQVPQSRKGRARLDRKRAGSGFARHRGGRGESSGPQEVPRASRREEQEERFPGELDFQAARLFLEASLTASLRYHY